MDNPIPWAATLNPKHTSSMTHPSTPLLTIKAPCAIEASLDARTTSSYYPQHDWFPVEARLNY